MSIEDATAWSACVAATWKVIDDDLDTAIPELEQLLELGHPTARGETAFLLGLARLAQFQPPGPRMRAAAAAFDIAADSGSDCAPAAAYCHAALVGTATPTRLEETWRRVLDTGSRSLAPAAAFILGHHHATAGDAAAAEEMMAYAYASADPEYTPKAALWLIEKHGRSGQWEIVDRIRSTINTRIGPTFQHSTLTRRTMQVPLWRAQLLSNDATPRVALVAAHALAVFDAPDSVPALLQRLHASDGRGDADEALGSMPGPWWLPIVRDHDHQNTAHELASELFSVLDRIYTGPALAHAERNVEDPDAMVAGIVHAIDGLSWTQTFRDDLRRRLESLPGAPLLPQDWLDH